MKQTLAEFLRNHLSFSVDDDRKQATIKSISESSVFSGPSIWVLIFAIFIASLGLNVNSTAVIIGAMLISPLMGPILGMGLGLGINDYDLLKRAGMNFAFATLVSIITATIYFLISPLNEAQSELLARTSPTLYDVMIALCGGAAGIVATANYDRGNNVIPGVAIATALMPPLCTAGYGLATMQWQFFLGAFYLFFINTVFICGATYVGIRFMRFDYIQVTSSAKALRTKRIAIAIVIATIIPAGIMTFNIVQQSLKETQAEIFINEQISRPGSVVINHSINRTDKRLSVVVIGNEIKQENIEQATERLKDYGLSAYSLEIIQGSRTDSLYSANKQLNKNEEKMQITIENQKKTIAHLNDEMAYYHRFDDTANEITEELQLICPEAEALSLAAANSSDAQHYTIAIVDVRDAKKVNREMVEKWLTLRLGGDSVKVVFNRL
jgi:uncharacterized hydrophobic protein (TIGR00271 family)